MRGWVGGTMHHAQNHTQTRLSLSCCDANRKAKRENRVMVENLANVEKLKNMFKQEI